MPPQVQTSLNTIYTTYLPTRQGKTPIAPNFAHVSWFIEGLNPFLSPFVPVPF